MWTQRAPVDDGSSDLPGPRAVVDFDPILDNPWGTFRKTAIAPRQKSTELLSTPPYSEVYKEANRRGLLKNSFRRIPGLAVQRVNKSNAGGRPQLPACRPHSRRSAAMPGPGGSSDSIVPGLKRPASHCRERVASRWPLLALARHAGDEGSVIPAESDR